MKIITQARFPEKGETDIAVLFVFNDQMRNGMTPEAASPFLAKAAPWLADSPALNDFKAKKDELVLAYGQPGSHIPRVLLAGLGDAKKFSPDALRACAGKAARRCRELGLRGMGVAGDNFTILKDHLQAAGGETFPETLLAEETALAALCALYKNERFSFRKPRPENAGKSPDFVFMTDSEEEAAKLRVAGQKARQVYTGIALARDLVTAPGNVATPMVMANEALNLANRSGFAYSAYDQDQIRNMGMGAFASVFKATDCARLIVLEYAPAGAENADPFIAVGKGLTFDSGGISLKPAAKMHEMKCDMAGGAAVLGLFAALGEMSLAGTPCERRVVGIIGCTENMPGSDAAKPGDVVMTYAGKSVEIQNTDAEGRLVLCDLLAYAQNLWKPAAIVDLATLTGACIVALGTDVAGLFCEDECLSQRIQENGRANGERFWPMPLWDSYAEPLLKNEVADMANMGSREGGAVFAAVFLKQFIKEGTAWAHLDIAGPAFSDKSGPLTTPGGTGFGVRTLIDLCRS